jgi:hypothetical protein
MDAAVLAQLVAKLLVSVQLLAGFDLPAEPPEVVFVPHERLQDEACDGPCDVYGWFPPGRTIYLDDRLDPIHDFAARGILVHELVHYLQQESGTFPARGGCRTWLERERQAYDIQMRWHAEQASAPGARAYLEWRPWKLTCFQDPERNPRRQQTRSATE